MSKGNTRWLPTTIFLIALAPVVLAIIAFRLHWFEDGVKTNKGQLLTPILNLNDLGLASQGKWEIWFVTPRCEQACVQTLDKLQRLYQIQGKEIQRVKLAMSLLETKSQPIKNMHFYTLDSKRYQQFMTKTALKPARMGDIYLVDPLGNIFMHYTADASLKSIHHDLSRVLKVSRIG